MSSVVVQKTTNVVEVTQRDPHVSVVQNPAEVHTTRQTSTTSQVTGSANTVEVVAQGPMGPPGETGTPTFNMVADGTISALRVVSAGVGGTVHHTDVSDFSDVAAAIGISITAATDGNQVGVQADGTLTDALWSWTPGPIWCGADGALTQTTPAGNVFPVARALSATRIIIDLDTPIQRA